MSRRNPTTPAGFSVPPARCHVHQPQPSRYAGEASRVGQAQHAANDQGQIKRYQVTPSGLVQITRQYHPATQHAHHQIQAVQCQPSQSTRPHPSYPNAGPPQGFVTKNGRQIPVWHNSPAIKGHDQLHPGPPDGYFKENGREVPVWYNPPGIVDKEMTPAAQAEYDRVRRQIVNGRR